MYDKALAVHDAENTYTDSENRNSCIDNGRTLITASPNPTSFDDCKARCDELDAWDFNSVDPPVNFDVS